MMRSRARITSGTVRPFVKTVSVTGETNHVATGEAVRTGTDPNPVDLGAVGGSEVFDPELASGAPDQGVSTAHLVEREHHVGIAGAPDQGTIGADVVGDVTGHQACP